VIDNVLEEGDMSPATRSDKSGEKEREKFAEERGQPDVPSAGEFRKQEDL